MPGSSDRTRADRVPGTPLAPRGKRGAQTLAALGVVFALSGCGPLDGRGDRASTAAHNRTALHVPIEPGEPLVRGWRVVEVGASAGSDSRSHVVRLSDGRRVVDLPLGPVDSFGNNEKCLFSTRNLCALEPLPGGIAFGEARGAVEELARRTMTRDRVAHNDEASRNHLYHTVLVGMVLVLFGLTAWILAGLIREWRDPWVPWALLGIVAIGAVLRTMVSPWTFLHEYFHYPVRFGALFSGENQPYGDVGFALYSMADRIFGGEEAAVFGVNAALASLTVGAVILFDFALFRRWPRALFAGWILCLLPQHVRYSGSEVLLIPLALFSLWGLAVLVLYFERPRTSTLLVGVLALFLATQCRPEGFAVPLLALLLAITTRPRSDLRTLVHWRTMLGAAILVALVAVQWFVFRPDIPFSPRATHEGLRHVVWFDSEATPPGLWVLWTLGLAWGLRERFGATLWVCSSAFLLTLGSLYLYTNPLYDLRSQVPSAPLHAILAAGAISLVRDWRPGMDWLRRLALAGVVAVPALALPLRHDFVEERLASQQEWDFLREAVPDLPGGPGCVLVSYWHGVTFPADLLLRHGKVLNPVNLDRWIHAGSPLRPECPTPLYYEGMGCSWDPAFEAGEGTLHPLCAAMRRDHELHPIVTRTLQGRMDPWLHRYGTDDAPFEVGFYRIVKRVPGRIGSRDGLKAQP